MESAYTQSATLDFQIPSTQRLIISRGILKLSVIYNMTTVTQRYKKTCVYVNVYVFFILIWHEIALYTNKV